MIILGLVHHIRILKNFSIGFLFIIENRKTMSLRDIKIKIYLRSFSINYYGNYYVFCHSRKKKYECAYFMNYNEFRDISDLTIN